MKLTGFRDKRVLLLQGPVGPYFRWLANDLEAQGATVYKVNFSGGDALFYPGGINYRGGMGGIPLFVEKLTEELQIDTIMLFGDCRPVHAAIHAIARRQGLDLRVFEEGYLRPNYITCEKFGVNGYSAIPRSAQYYRAKARPVEPAAKTVGKSYWHMAAWASAYYLAASLAKPLFPHYEHHRPLTIAEALPWIRGAWRKLYYRVKEHGIQKRLTEKLSKRFYVVPLQVHNDTQVTVHSPFDHPSEFIEKVVESFARHAPNGAYLVIKHHPMDRAYTDYTKLVRELSERHGLDHRLVYIHDQHLPTLFDHALGAVVINSTAGLGAIHHGTPTHVNGDAIYDFEGLTFQGSLDEFWKAAPAMSVDMDLYRRFRSHLIRHTQINGSFYRRCSHSNLSCGTESQFQQPHSEAAQ